MLFYVITVLCACLSIVPRVACQQRDDFDADYLPGHSQNNDKSAEFNERCRTGRDCRHFGYVCRDNKTCQCDYMYIPNAVKKTCVGGVNQRCMYDEHCIDGAFCMNQSKCRCKDSSPNIMDDGLLCSGTHKLNLDKTFYTLLILPLISLIS